MPASRERAGLGLAIAHHYKGDQVWMVVPCPIGVRDAVAELTARVDAARGFRSRMAADPAGEAELLEKSLHASKVFTLVWIDLGICSFQVRIRQDGRCTVSGAGDKDCVQVVFLYQSVQMYVGEALACVRAPVAQQAGLGLLDFQWLAQQRIFL